MPKDLPDCLELYFIINKSKDEGVSEQMNFFTFGTSLNQLNHPDTYSMSAYICKMYINGTRATMKVLTFTCNISIGV